MIAKLYVNRKTEELARFFDYNVPPALDREIKKGDIVAITFNGQATLGIIMQLVTGFDDKLLFIESIKKTSLLDEAFFNLYDQMKKHTMVSENVFLLDIIPAVIFKSEFKNENKKESPTAPKQLLRAYLATNQITSKITYLKDNIKNYDQIVLVSSDVHLLDYYYQIMNVEDGFCYHPYVTLKQRKQALQAYINGQGIIFTTPDLLFFTTGCHHPLLLVDDLKVISSEYNKTSYNCWDLLKYKERIATFDLVYLGYPNVDYAYTYQNNLTIIPGIKAKETYQIVNIHNKVNNIHEDIINLINGAIKQKELVVIYNARKDHFLYLYCKCCHRLQRCKQCGKNLHYSSERHAIICNNCQLTLPYEKHCLYCGNKEVSYYGFGVENTYQELKKIFPLAKIKKVSSGYQKIKNLKKEECDIIIGSEGLNKWLALPVNTHYILFNTDLNLFLPGYDSFEQVFFTIKKFVQQTQYPLTLQIDNHYPAFYDFLQKDHELFISDEINNRLMLKNPPVVTNYQILYQSNLGSYLESFKRVKHLKEALNKYNPLGPYEINSKSANYIFSLIIKDRHITYDMLFNELKKMILTKEEGLKIIISPYNN